MITLFVTDPLDLLDPAVDTSIGLMHAAQERGAEVWATEPGRLEVADGRVRTSARRVHLAASRPLGDHRWLVPSPWITTAEPEPLELDRCAAVFIRTEPPVDLAYLTAMHLLDLVDRSCTAVVNDPAGIRACSEHLLPLAFPDLAPPTVVSADAATLRAFAEGVGRAVVKPVDGFAGRGVLLLDPADPNLPSLLETATERGTRPVIVQPYLAEVVDGNKRIFLWDGEPLGAVFRFPADGDFRIGCPSAPAPLTARDREICARLAPVLRRHGLRLAGLDVIGPHLIEVNVTSPGALRKADGLLGWSLCADVLDAVLNRSDLRSWA
jgi:glutathione synthase